MTQPRPRPLILLADDYRDAREMYTEYLVYEGFDVVTACDGEDALRVARRVRPDVILMDMMMPVLDGWEATRRLKADAGLRTIPVVALTAHTVAGDVVRMTEAGCDAIVAKPCLPADLLSEIRRRLAVTKWHPC